MLSVLVFAYTCLYSSLLLSWYPISSPKGRAKIPQDLQEEGLWEQEVKHNLRKQFKSQLSYLITIWLRQVARLF